MTISLFTDLAEWEDPDLDPDDSGPVGREQPPPPVTATRIGIGKNGDVELFEEVEIEVIRGRALDLRTKPSASGCPPQLANTLEVRCPAERCGPNHSVVVAAYPYSVDWFASASFKPTRFQAIRDDTKHTEAVVKLLERLQDSDDPQSVLEQADFDPFESRKVWMTARLVGPFQRTAGTHITVRMRGNDGVGLSQTNRSITWKDPECERTLPPTWLWGICENLPQCYKRLIDSPEITQILKSPESILSNSDSVSVRSGFLTPPAYVIPDNRMAELFASLAVSGMHASIMKALAGMPPNIPYFWKLGTEKRALDLVLHVFRSFAFNLAKRLGGRDLPPTYSTDERDGAHSSFLEIPEEIEDRYQDWLPKIKLIEGDKTRIEPWFELIRRQINSEDEEKIIDGCGMVAASAGILDLASWIVPCLRRLETEQKNPRMLRSLQYALARIGDE